MNTTGEGFSWGTTSASTQVEGVAPAADWSRWERDRVVPASADGNGFATNFVDDLGLIASLGVTDVRITIEWARVEPFQGKVHTDALDRYTDMIAHARSVGLTPWLTLVNTTLPGWFSEDGGGFADERGREYHWMRHVDRCAERFAELAHGWTPIEDPVGLAMRAYSLASRPPGQRTDTAHGRLRHLEMTEGALLADHLAARHLGAGGALTMSSRNTPTIFAVVDDPTSDLEADAADRHVRWWAAMVFDSWASMALDGELVLPDRRGRHDSAWIGDFDIIGIGFDHPIGIDAHGNLRSYPPTDTGHRSDSGFVPRPEELGIQLRRLADRFGSRPLAITSNGVSVTDDDRRVQVLSETLDVVRSARADGIELVGYFHDTAIDGYEWRAGFETQRGLITRDRTPKQSAHLYADTIAAARPNLRNRGLGHSAD